MTGEFFEACTSGALPPGRMMRVDRGARRILLANVEGHYYAVDDTCTHEDASLSSGVLEGDRVRCPLHGSRFCLRTGAALEEPAEARLATYPVRVDGARVLIGATDAAAP